jgi:hypothetical protein
MKVETLLNCAMTAFKQKFLEVCPEGPLPDLTADSFAHLVQIFKESFSACGTTALKAYLESCDEKDDVLASPFGKVRFKMESPKEFLTPFGWVLVARRLYQTDAGDVSFVPLDEKWDMRGETLTPVVREAIHYISGHNTPQVAEVLLSKCALFTPSRTAILHANEGFGTVWKQHGAAILAKVREKETVALKTHAVVVSLDGVNVLMNEKGKKRGRKRHRPSENPSEETTTSYQNAMVGSVSVFRPPEKEEEGPQRLLSRYVARMPQEEFPDFKAALEAEVATTFSKLPAQCRKIVIVDGSRGLWNHVKTNPLYKRCLALVDFWHATEYLAKAAEAAYGANSYEGQGWFRRWKESLLKEPGAAKRTLRAMSYLLKSRNLRGKRRKDLLTAQGFFGNNMRRMNYAGFHNRNLPVGSGVVEAACKSIVKARMCLSGMRWTKEGGETILSIRTVIKSNRWDECWREYQAIRLAA